MVCNSVISEGMRLRGPFWPEEMEVVKCQSKAGFLFATAKDVKTGSLYECTLSPHDAGQVKILEGRGIDFAALGHLWIC